MGSKGGSSVKTCYKCGLPIAFKLTPKGRWCPTNLDGSDHWDLCRQTWLANMSPAERAYYAERDRIAGLPAPSATPTTATHVWTGEVPPWDNSLGSFRDFTGLEKTAGIVCRPL